MTDQPKLSDAVAYDVEGELRYVRKALAARDQRIAALEQEVERIRRGTAANPLPLGEPHAFVPGDPEYGWERQCAAVVLHSGETCHCGYPPEAHVGPAMLADLSPAEPSHIGAKDPHEDCMRALYRDENAIATAIAAWLESRGDSCNPLASARLIRDGRWREGDLSPAEPRPVTVDVRALLAEGFEIAVDHADISEHNGWHRTDPYNDWTVARRKLDERLATIPADPEAAR
jgi:hypothetical protein